MKTGDLGMASWAAPKRTGRYSNRIQSYLSTHGKPRLVPLILTIRLDVLRNIPVHYLYDVVNVEQATELHSAPFSTGPAVCLMIAKRKVGAGTEAFES